METLQPNFTRQEFINAYNQEMDVKIFNGSFTEKDRWDPNQLKRFWAANEKIWARNKVSLKAAVNEAVLDVNVKQAEAVSNFMSALHEHHKDLDFENDAYQQREQAEIEKLSDDTKKQIWDKAKRDLQALQHIEEMLNSNSQEAKEYKNALSKLIYIYSGSRADLRQWYYPKERKTEIPDLF